MDKKQRVIFYIDGFNFYYGLKSRKWAKYYWLDIVKFCSLFLKPHQELVCVKYFSAIPINKGKADRQDLLFSANKLNPKFELILGKFLSKSFVHRECGKVFHSHEEKETDVHIATNMIRGVVLDKCDVSILISADSDLIPAINFMKELNNKHKLFVYFPPDRFSYDLMKTATNSLKLESHIPKFDLAILQDEVVLTNGFKIKRPKEWT